MPECRCRTEAAGNRKKCRCLLGLRCILLSFMLHRILSYPAPYWVSLHTFLCTLWAMLHPTELRLHSIKLYNTPYLATLQPVELWWSLLSYPLPPCWAMLYPSELRCNLLSHGALYWATIEIRCTLLSYAEPYSAMLNQSWAQIR
jgi:hypothetical protein